MEEVQESSSANKRKTSKTSVACAACKSRKTKCSGEPPPCTSCSRLNTVCVFHPGSDMRRRDSKDHFKAYKALLDAFVASTRSGDVNLSSSLYRAIQLTDSSGKLAEIAQSYAQAIKTSSQDDKDLNREFEYKVGKTTLSLPATSPITIDTDMLLEAFAPASVSSSSPTTRSEIDTPTSAAHPASLGSRHSNAFDNVSTSTKPTVDVACQTDPMEVSQALARQRRVLYHLQSTDPEERLFSNFEELLDFWEHFHETGTSPWNTHLSRVGNVYDLKMIRAEDPMSKAIVEFRDGARRAIEAGANIDEIIGSATPSLETFFTQDANTPIHSAWSWACQFARALALPLVLQLSNIYLVGIQMRFFILPTAQTFNDLPPMLRPLRKQYTIPHPAAVDICHFPRLKAVLLSRQTEYDSILMKVISNQSCSWPYSNSACFTPMGNATGPVSMSQAFIEHIRNVENYTIPPATLESVAQMTGQVMS